MQSQAHRFKNRIIAPMGIFASLVFISSCGVFCERTSIDATPFVGEAAQSQTLPMQVGRGHHFICTDYSGQKVFEVQPDGSSEFIANAPNSNDIWALPDGNLLFTTGRGVREMDTDRNVVFEYESDHEIYACQRLANGDTFIAECDSGRLLEVNRQGDIVKEVRLLPEGESGGHGFMRNARKLDNGHYLVAHYGPAVVREYDPAGKQIREIPAPGGVHSVARLKNGNTLIAITDQKVNGKADPRMIEVDPDGTIVWQVSNADLPGAPLRFLTGFHRLPNGNTVMTNWVGHGHIGKAPHIIEVTPDKRIVWLFQDHQTMKTISSIQVLDVPGDPINGEIIH